MHIMFNKCGRKNEQISQYYTSAKLSVDFEIIKKQENPHILYI